jgi:nitrogen regulatory protein P-II 1
VKERAAWILRQNHRTEDTMKEIKAIIRPSKLLVVTEELHEIEGLPGVTVSEIKGFGKGRAKNAKDEIVYEMVALMPRIQLEVVVHDEMVDEVVNVIQKYAHTGNAGDGKIFVSTVDEVVKIRTNERGRDAL